MKVLNLSTFDQVGGAARAAYRIHQSLQNAGVESQMLVQYKKGNDSSVFSVEDKVRSRLRSLLNDLPLKFYPVRQHGFSTQWFPDSIAQKVDQINPDIVNLNWICNGYLSIETLPKLNKPLVWILHDLWPFTGGCHYSYGCDRYQNCCGSCPHLKSKKEHDLSFWTWKRKAKAWKNLNLTIVSPSKWLAKLARSSSIFQDFPVEVIPHGLDTKKYQPIDKSTARAILQLPQNKKLVLFGTVTSSSEPRKGFSLLKSALESLSQSSLQDTIELVVFGPVKSNQFLDFKFQVHCLGKFYDDISLAVIYSAADVTVVSSTQEAFGQVASESLACGTPVVAFGATGLLDIIEHQQNGYLAAPFQIEDLAQGITWVVENSKRYQQLSNRARQKAEAEFSLPIQGNRYLSLFDQILSKQRKIYNA